MMTIDGSGVTVTETWRLAWMLTGSAAVAHDRRSFGSRGRLYGSLVDDFGRWPVTNYCRTRLRSVVMTNGWRSVAACWSAAIATPTSRTALRPPPGRPTSSTAWWCCTRHCAVRKPVPCPRTERSSRAPSARASSPDTEISQSLKRH